MKLLAAITAVLLLAFGSPGAELTTGAGARLTRFDAVPGSKVVLKGDYSIHQWKAEGTLICGFLEVTPGFPGVPESSGEAAKLSAHGEVFIPVRNLKAVGENWEPYNEQRTGIIHRMLHADDHPRIYFRLSQLETRVQQPGKGPLGFTATGRLTIAGVTNQISFPVAASRVEGEAIQITGKTTIKQSDFGIIPKPTGFRCFAADPDPVEIAFDWLVKETGKK
jgi:hypothetical protein